MNFNLELEFICATIISFMRNRRGEIATILTLGVMIVIGITAVISSFTVKDKKTTSSRASEACDPLTEVRCGITCCPKPTRAPTPTPAAISGCSYSQSFCPEVCGANNCVKCSGSGATTKYKCRSGSTTTPTSVPTTGGSCPEGSIQYDTESSCVDYCDGQGGTYIKNSRWTDTAGQHCCCKSSDTALGFDGCCKAYRPDMYDCPGQNKVVIYAQSMSAVGMTSCSAYNKGTTTALYFACDPAKYSDGGCHDVWKGEMGLEEKNNQANLLIATPTPVPENTPIPEGTPIPEDTPVPNASGDCVGIESVRKCGSTKYTSGFPFRKSVGSKWYCCKTEPLSGETVVPTEDPTIDEDGLKNTPEPSTVEETGAFCPNPRIPQFPSGIITGGITNEHGEGKVYDLSSYINAGINSYVGVEMKKAQNINEIRSGLTSVVSTNILSGASAIWTNIANSIDTSGLNYVTLHLVGFGVRIPLLITIRGSINIMALSTKFGGTVGIGINAIANSFVDSVINSICN